MQTDKNVLQNKEHYTIEFKNIPKELLPWLEDLAWEYRARIEKKEWKSKYNNYVIYDYEPFCSDGFEINVTLCSKSHQFLNFIRFLYENKVRLIEYIKRCYVL